MKFVEKLFTATYALLASIGLTCCDASRILQVHELIVSPPPRPEIWHEIPYIEYRIYWRNPEGGMEERRLEENERAVVSVSRGVFQCMKMEAIARFTPSGEAFRLRPAGMLYPHESARSGDRLVASWSQGYICEVDEALERGSFDPDEFNLPRMEAIVDGASADPWFRPIAESAKDLTEGRFRQDAFAPARQFHVRLPGPGPWYPESPFGEAVVELPEAGCEKETFQSEGKSMIPVLGAKLPAGIQGYFGPSGRLLVKVEEDGSFLWVRSSFP